MQPPDFSSHKKESGLPLTEQTNIRAEKLDKLSTEALLILINEEEQKTALAVKQAIPEITIAVDAITQCFKAGGRLFYVGAGTSGRLGVLDASECPPTFGVEPYWVQGIIAGGEKALTEAIEGAEDDAEAGQADILAKKPTSNDVVVGISASGGAPYVLGALKAAKASGVRLTVAIVCSNTSPLQGLADISIITPVGPEVLSGSTRLKAGTAQKMVLNMLTTASMIGIGKTYGNLMVDVQPTNEKLRLRALNLLTRLGKINKVAAKTLLEETKWQVKPAIVMARLACSLREAEEKLTQANGFLRKVLGE